MDFNFKHIGDCDVCNLIEKFNNLDEEIWLEHQYRQNMKKGKGTHRNTNSIEILWDPECLKNLEIGTKSKNYDLLEMDEFFDSIKPLYQKEYGDGYFLHALFARLKANTNIKEHFDRGESLTLSKRTHIPIKTNPNIKFKVGGEEKYIKSGEIWEINNSGKKHGVVNNSGEDRIHLILDYICLKDIPK